MGWSKATKPPSGISYFFVLVFVIVPVLSQIPPGPPSIDGPQVIVLNSNPTLTCTSARGDPPPTVKWLKDDQEITNGVSTTQVGTAVTTSLTFTATKDDHFEVFECQAENGVLQNPLSTTKFIEVHFPPDAPTLTGPTTLTPGQQGTWTCISANGFPAGAMTMRNQNKNTQFTSSEFTTTTVLDVKSYDVTGVLTWSPVIVNNGDTICCDVTHTTTSSTPQTICRQITVANPIAINAPVTQYTPTLQTTVTLQCDVTQGTASEIIWIKDNVQLNINTNSRLSGGTVPTESLTITNVQQSDGGNYVCRGIDAVTGNIVNTDTINVNPVGTPPITSIPQSSYTQITGQQIILGCTVQSPNSPLQEVQWTFTNNQGQTTDPISVSTSNGKYSGSSVNSPSLTINSVASTDQGTYSCKARNLVGTSTNNPTTSLTVTGSIPVVQINPTTYSATYGSQVVINCNIVSASPAATQVYWQRSSNNQILRIDNGDQGYQGSTTSTPSLTINFATTANAGVYTCFATNAVGTGSSNLGTVTITGGLLSVFVTPQNQNVVQGAQQRITCTVSGTPAAQNIAWLFTAAGSNQQTQLNTGNSQKYSLGTTQDPFLTVLNFQPSDAGTYVCRATNAAGSTSSNPGATLTYITVPTTNVEPRQYTATVGDASFQIQCLVTATPGATSWYWTFQPVGGSQQTIAQGTNDQQYTVDNSGTNPHLTIKSIALNEAGIYTCYATNAAGTSDSSNNPSSRHTLTVTGAILTVTISPATANVIRGNTQTIDCNPQGNPAATQITWYFTPSGSNSQQLLNIANSGGKYNGGTPGNPDLTITDFQTNNAGSYRCAATNAAGTGTSSNSVLTYVDPLSISVTPADGTAIYGDASYTIQCTITGTTPTSSSWSKRPVSGGVVSPISAGGKYLIANSANAPHLTINNVVEDDEQDYFCQATNAAGTVTSSRARLIVNGGLLSVAISPSNADVLQGQSQLISCTVTGTPSATAISWRFTPSGSSQQQTLSLGNTAKYSGGTTQNPSLTVQNFQSSDGGSYVCSATNAVGTSSSTTSVLRYIQQLTISVSPSDGTAIYGDSSYTIQCSITGTPQATSWSWVRMPISGGGETPISAGTKYSIVNSATAPHLTINNVVEDDEQDYYCRATNVAGTQTSTRARLIVNGGLLSVTISPANADVLQGQSQLISCTVTGTPSATAISWRFTPSGSNQQQTLSLGNTAKYSGGTTQNPSLTVLNFQSSDGGSYVCSATNAVGTSTSTTSVLRYIQQLTISVSPSDGTAVYGTASYTIQCSITGTPQATSWTWQRRPQAGGSLTTISSGSKYSIVNSATAPHLTINNIVESDEQDYFCGATNVAGSQTSSRARLTVTGDLLSVSISPANADVLQGQSQLITCIVSGNPAATSISWRFTPSGSNQQQTLSLGNTAKYSGGTTQNPSLTVLNFQSSDGGTYVCSATNAVGTQSSTTSVLRYIQQLTISVSPSDGIAIYGDSSYTIQCSITGTPQATSWSWVRMPISGGGETPISAGTKYTIVNSATAPHLTINNIVEADEQDYYCRATNVAGTQTSTRARLIVNGDLLSVSISPANADVLQGQSQLITCTVSGNPAATVITWFFTPSSSNQQQTLSLGNTAKYSGGTTQNPSLTVLNFQSSDGGTYVCSATNAVGSQSSTTSILRFIQQLTIAVSPSDGTAVYGTASYTIQCSITGTPQATSWTWQRRPQAGGSLTTISSGNKYSIVNSATAPHLTINNIVEDDEQDYFCGATNVAGSQTSSRARLTVTGDLLSVSISPANADVLQGQSQLITCIVSGNPAATSISWRFTPSGSNQQQTLSLSNTAKYSGGTTQNPSLTVLNFQSSDGGSYVCSATNAVGTRSSTTSVLRYIQQLSVTVSPSDGTAVYGDSSYTIQCSITGTPQATSWTWTRRPTAGGSETTISGGTKYTIVNSATAPHLTINSIVEADEQDYFCAATNVAGTQTSTRARLTVTGELLTVSISPANAEVIRGNSQIITCTVSGNPSVTNVAWTKDGQSVNVAGNPTKYSGGTPGNPSLTVTNFETTDAGSYVCIATNAVGSQSSSTSVLTYIEFLSLTVSPSSGSAVLGAQSYVIACQITGNPTATNWYWTKTPSSGGQSENINRNTNNNKYTVQENAQNPQLTIKNIQQSDDANYVCNAQNTAGLRTSSAARLIVTGQLASITASPSTQFANYGANSVTIQCSVSASPSATAVGWRKVSLNGQTSTEIDAQNSNNKYSIVNSLTAPHLTINNVDFNDDSNYVCFATNAVGTGTSNNARVDVIGSAPQVSIPQSAYSVIYGSDITIPCTILNANPAHFRVTWYYTGSNNQQTTINTGDPSQYSGGVLGNPGLTILNANNQDAGFYKCEAENQVNSGQSSNTQLNVIGDIPVVQLSKTTEVVVFDASVTLVCSIRSQNPVVTEIVWQFTNSNQITTQIVISTSAGKYSGSTVNNPSLTINNAVFQDAGTYQCFARNAVGTGQSSTLALGIAGGALTVTIPSSTYSVLLGNQISITCTVSGSPSATNVYWMKQQTNGGSFSNVDITGNNRYSGGTLSSPTLVINSAQFSDEGNYRCHGVNAAGDANSIVTNLDVTGNVPTVTLTTTLFPVLVGNDITIGCNVISNPGATNVYWRFENSGSQITTISPNSNTAKYGGSTTTSPSLVIKNVDFSDAGKYTCYATNSIGTGNSQEGTLQVSGQPPNVVVTLPNYSVDFGQQVTLGCTVTANPAHTSVYWTKNKNGIVTNINVANSGGKYSGSTVGSPSLTITNSNLDDQASYICNAQNSVGLGSSSSTVLTVSGNIPIVTVTQNQYNVDYGNTVTLGCTVTANPTHSVVYWQKIKGGVTSTIDASAISNNARLSGSTVNSPSLVITNVNLDDIASYICFAQNSVGTGQSQQTNLAVSGALPTVVVLSNSYPVTVGGTVTLQCVVNANPGHTVVQWKRIVNGQTQDVTGVGAPGSGSRLSGSAVTSPSLTVSQASFADEGSYICTATNAIGQGSSSQTFLDVTGNVPTVQVTQSEFQGDFGQSVTLGCTVTANPSETRVYWKVLDSNGALQNIDTAVSRYSGSVVGSPSLMISGLNKADQAFYQCFADNDVGTGQSSQTFLRVLGEVPAVTTPATHQFTLGTTATLSCTVNANPAATSVSWSKYNNQNQLVAIDMGTNNNQKYQGSTVGNPSLTILNTVSGDAGRYVCSASNAVGTGNSGTSTLDITGALPIVNIPQSTYAISIGNQITLGCTVSATPKETAVFWTRQYPNAGEITVSKVNSAKYQGQTVSSPSLIILNTDFNDIATYRCYATNTVGTGSSNPTSLTVSGNVPNVVIPLSQYSVNFGSSATIPCTVTANPTHTSVQWKIILNGQEQNVDMQNNKYSGGTVNSPALVIANAQQGDETFYICTAANSVGAGRSIQTFLRVAGDRPQVAIGSSTYQVQKYGTVELVCTITANPAANTVQWYRYDGGVQTSLRNVAGKYNTPTVNSPNLQIINADLSDRGYYICTAANIVGTGTSSSTFVDVTGNEPIVTIPLPNYNGQFGGNVELTCNVVANPSATVVYWTKTVGGQSTTIGQSTGKYSFSVSSPSLMISNLDASDKASYTCYATNSIGSGNSQPTTLDVIGSIPQVTVPATVSVNIGSTATLTCSIQANPTHNSISWQRIDGNNQATTITIDNNKYSGATVNNPTLTITNVQMSDRVNYVCFATNSVGTGQSGSLFLNVQGNPPVVSIASNTYQAPWGNSVTLVCTVTANPTHTSVSWKKIQNGVVTNIVPANNPSKYEGSTVSSPSLIIKNADRNSDQAFYECAATNTIGTGTSSRTFLTVTGDIPVVQIPDNYQVEIGQSVVVVCTVTSNPAHTTVQWKRVNNNQETNLDISDSSQYQNGNLQNPSLTILNAATDDEGYYRCTATNSVGTGTSALSYVDVTGNILQVTVPQNIYNVNYGQSVQLVCTVTGSPAVTDVYWVKVRNSASTTIRATTMDNSKYSGVSLNNPSLTILNANQDDIAVYKCYGRNVVGLGESQQTQLNVIGSRPAVNVDTSVSVTLGNSVTLQCTVIATPSATMVRWNKVSSSGTSTPVDVTNNPTKYAGGSLSVPSLTIYNAQNTDESTYTCQATNAVGTTVSSQVNLDVVGTIPQVNIGQSQYSVTIGQTITLICTVTANPAHTIVYWRRNVNGVFTDLQSSNRYTGSSVSNPSLTITNTVAGDIGDYKCYATNSVGTGESAQTLLNVVGSAPVVNVASNAYSVNIGNSITLQCNVQANPFHTSVKWQRVDVNGNAVDIDMTNSRYTGSEVNSPSLVISQTMKSDEGRYVCLATNAVGTGQSQQTYLTVVGSTPTVTVDQPQYSANKGSDITLQCSYTANPAATMVRWERANGNTVVEIGDTTNNNKYGGSTVSSPSLIIYNAEESDEGVYKCKVTNSVGTGISTTTNLDVVGNIPIVTVPTSAYTVNVDGSITLACQVTADPTHTQVYWQKVTGGNTQTITINGGKYTGSSVNVPGLTISNAQFADAGTYYCFARNSVGTGSSTQVVLAVSGNTPSVSLTQNAMTVNYGNNVTIGCVVSANPSHTSVYWQKISGGNTVTIDMSNTNKYGGGTVASPSLNIIRADTSDAANYVCFAANSVGTGQSSQGTLTVAGSVPVVTIPQNQYTINVGTDMTIPCNIQSNPQHTQVYWTKKVGNSAAQNIPQGTSDYGGGNVNSPSLIIYNVEEADEAQYNCFAVNIVGTGSASSPTFLNVIGNPPVVTASIPNSVRLGDPVTITCVVTANPGATQIRWKFITNNAESVIDINNNNRYTGGTVQTPSLTISPVEEVDRGSYKCEATNAEGTASSSPVFLNTVGDPPTNLAINPSPITVEEGEVITATCSATGNPNPTFEWRKLGSDNVISNSPVLTINNAQESHKGTYICKAINTMGSGEVQTTVTVHFKPKVTITTTPVQGKKGQSVEIPCEFTSNPFATSVIWTKIVGGQSSQLNLNGNKYQGATVTHPSLTILDLQASDIADYRCSVLNNVGVGNSNIGRVDVDLTVAPFGIMITPNGITVLEGNAFSMFCNATANPSPQYEWYHKDTKVGDGQTYTVQNSIWTPHDGLYTCKAYNSAGEQQATIDVDVKYIPVSAVTTNSFSQGLNSPITLSCDTLANPSAISWQWKYNGFILDGQTEKLYTVDMNNEQDAGQYTCIAYNEVGHSADIHFSVTVGSGVTPGTGASVASAGLTGGEIAAICLGILFFILLLIVLCVCCILQGCCAMCFGAGAGKDKERRITPDHEKLDIPRFYEVPTVVTREPSMISKRDVYVDTVPMAYGAARGERYVTHSAASRPYYLPAIEYTYDEEERRRRRRKKKKSRHHQDELRGDEQIVLEERVVSNGGGDIYRTTSSRTGNDVEVIAGPEYYFEAE
ncbi:hemicentin-1-like isoform X2 [Mytilus galloprovincialis]|uniref:hemicentin-1-like isoform X2 n=1 Tax=Mytilus galloprovincialis TaxID=29158 RepID=UPI003F7CD257